MRYLFATALALTLTLALVVMYQRGVEVSRVAAAGRAAFATRLLREGRGASGMDATLRSQGFYCADITARVGPEDIRRARASGGALMMSCYYGPRWAFGGWDEVQVSYLVSWDRQVVRPRIAIRQYRLIN